MADDKTPEQLRLEAFSTDGMRCKGGCGGESEFCGADMLRFAASEVQRDRDEAAKGSAPETQRVDADAIRAQARAEAFGEVLTIIRQEGYAEFPDGKLLPSSEDVECIELAVKELAGGAEMSEQRRPAVDVEWLANHMRDRAAEIGGPGNWAWGDIARAVVEFIGKNGGRP